MGTRSAPSPKVIQPKVYKSVTPLKSYKQAADYLAELRGQRQSVLDDLYAQAGTPAELGARMAGYRLQEAGSYLSSLPGQDKFSAALSPGFDPYGVAKEAAQTDFDLAQGSYERALENIDEQPDRVDPDYMPKWAQSTVSSAMPNKNKARAKQNQSYTA